MGKLYDAVVRVDEIIARKNLHPFKTRGQISLRAGFALGIVDPSTPDDTEQLEQLRAAVREILSENI